jgi:hypothetical protein
MQRRTTFVQRRGIITPALCVTVLTCGALALAGASIVYVFAVWGAK